MFNQIPVSKGIRSPVYLQSSFHQFIIERNKLGFSLSSARAANSNKKQFIYNKIQLPILNNSKQNKTEKRRKK